MSNFFVVTAVLLSAHARDLRGYTGNACAESEYSAHTLVIAELERSTLCGKGFAAQTGGWDCTKKKVVGCAMSGWACRTQYACEPMRLSALSSLDSPAKREAMVARMDAVTETVRQNNANLVKNMDTQCKAGNAKACLSIKCMNASMAEPGAKATEECFQLQKEGIERFRKEIDRMKKDGVTLEAIGKCMTAEPGVDCTAVLASFDAQLSEAKVKCRDTKNAADCANIADLEKMLMQIKDRAHATAPANQNR